MATTQENLDAVLTVLNEGHKESYDIEIGETEIEGTKIRSYGIKHSRPDLMRPIAILLKIPFYKKESNINRGELDLILKYLAKKGYVEHHDLVYILDVGHTDLYSITYLGKVLIESGGFIQKELDSTSSNRRIESLEDRTYLTAFWTAIAAALILIWEVWQYYFPTPIEGWTWIKSFF